MATSIAIDGAYDPDALIIELIFMNPLDSEGSSHVGHRDRNGQG